MISNLLIIVVIRADPSPIRRSIAVCDPWLLFQDRDVRQVAVLLRVIEPVADDEVILDGEADVIDLHVHLAARRLAEQAGRLHRSSGRAPSAGPAGSGA